MAAQQLVLDNMPTQQYQTHSRSLESSLEIESVVVTTEPSPTILNVSDSNGGVSQFASGPSKFSPKDTQPQLGGESLNKDKFISNYDLIEQMLYLYVRLTYIV
jgi:hypothetical protein